MLIVLMDDSFIRTLLKRPSLVEMRYGALLQCAGGLCVSGRTIHPETRMLHIFFLNATRKIISHTVNGAFASKCVTFVLSFLLHKYCAFFFFLIVFLMCLTTACVWSSVICKQSMDEAKPGGRGGGKGVERLRELVGSRFSLSLPRYGALKVLGFSSQLRLGRSGFWKFMLVIVSKQKLSC